MNVVIQKGQRRTTLSKLPRWQGPTVTFNFEMHQKSQSQIMHWIF